MFKELYDLGISFRIEEKDIKEDFYLEMNKERNEICKDIQKASWTETAVCTCFHTAGYIPSAGIGSIVQDD